MTRIDFLVALLCATLCSTAVSAADSSTAEYRASLLEVYGKLQGVFARRDACNTAFPNSRGSYEKAYTVWHDRHKRLIDEVEQRIALFIRAHSANEADYTRNYGKYQGAFLKQREDVKRELLQQAPADLEAACKGWPAFLQGPDSDLEQAAAEDLAVLRKRPLAKK